MTPHTFPLRFYQGIITLGKWLQSPFLLILRLYWGCNFFKGGIGKIGNIQGVAAFFSSLGIPLPELSAYAVGYLELIGGLCLIIGLAVRLISLPLIATMTVALLTASHKAALAIFSDPDTFLKEPPVTFLVVLLVLFVFGPGIFSIDFILQKLFKKEGTKGDCCH